MLNFCCPQMVLLLLWLKVAENNPTQRGSPGSSADCGRPKLYSPRIIGGQNSDEGEWPWQVSLRRNGLHHCGGSLIASQWVVTAAHCIKESQSLHEYQAHLGEHDLPRPPPTMVSSAISQIILHPHYAGSKLSADIALMRLEKPVRFSQSILPICLPSASVPEPSPVGMKCWVTGWGRPFQKASYMARTLREVEVLIIDTEECDQMYHKNVSNLETVPEDYKLIYNDMVCAGYPEGEKDSCWGDSGGPLACKQNGTWFLAGVVSFGTGCAQPSRPGVYTRVTSYMDWIQRTMADTDNEIRLRPSRASQGPTLFLLHLLLVLINSLF
ncbi:serine protease 27-like [Hemicordylus capensis]|uniref:serine protease 27-like n=1 Tax=Hemicordylus capensis TaxID=884348 RepID=UPI0023021F6A|nr:serine protease 27-like [Hemicordylus capensis]